MLVFEVLHPYYFVVTTWVAFPLIRVVHRWPSDILGGAAIGIAVGLLTHWIYQKYLKPKPAA